MDPNDWKPVILKKSPTQLKNQGFAKTESIKKISTASTSGSKNYKLDNDGDFSDVKLNKVSFSLKMKIMKARQNKGLTQKQLADKIGINVNEIKRYENGDVIPDSNILNKLGRELGVNLNKKD